MDFWFYINAPAPSYSDGGCLMLVRNATTGRFETMPLPVMTEADPVYTASIPHQMMVKGDLSTGDDLDNFIETGIWFAPSNAIAETLLNAPVPTSGTLFTGCLEVVRRTTGGSTTQAKYQTYTENRQGQRKWYRGWLGTTWGSWKQMAAISDFPAETDPTVPAHVKSITSTNISNWNTAFGWGNHATAGYLTSYTESDPTVPSHVKSITTTNISNWNTAFGWGNHSGLYVLLSGSYANPSWITSLAWSKITGAPTIPTVNNATLTLATSGIATGSQTFTANQATNATFTVNVPGTNISASLSGYFLTITSSTGSNGTVDLSPIIPATPTLQQVLGAGNSATNQTISVTQTAGTGGAGTMPIASFQRNGGYFNILHGVAHASWMYPTIEAKGNGQAEGSLYIKAYASTSSNSFSTGGIVLQASNNTMDGTITGGNILNVRNHTTSYFSIAYNGAITATNLSGTGTRMVTANASGVLSTAAVPSYTGSTSITLSGNSFQRAALTGDVTASANSNATTIANNVVTDAKLRDSVATSVIGRSANSSGDPADIQASADGVVLHRKEGALVFDKITGDNVSDNSVPPGKLSLAGAYTILANPTNAMGSYQGTGLGVGLKFVGGLLCPETRVKVYTQVHGASVTVPAGTTSTVVFSGGSGVAGVTPGEFLIAVPLAVIADKRVDIKARCTSAGTINVFVHNYESSTVTIPASQTWKFLSIFEN